MLITRRTYYFLYLLRFPIQPPHLSCNLLPSIPNFFFQSLIIMTFLWSTNSIFFQSLIHYSFNRYKYCLFPCFCSSLFLLLSMYPNPYYNWKEKKTNHVNWNTHKICSVPFNLILVVMLNHNFVSLLSIINNKRTLNIWYYKIMLSSFISYVYQTHDMINVSYHYPPSYHILSLSYHAY